MIAATTRRRATALLGAALLLTACGGGEDTDTTATSGEAVTAPDSSEPTGDPSTGDESMDDESMDGMTDEDMTDEDMTDEGMTDEGMTDEEDAAGAVGELASLTATAPDGSTFALGDFEGRPVLVETFATWCSNCRQQLGDTQQAAVEAGDDAVFLALSVESDLDPASLTGYAEDNGFADVTFGVLDDQSLLTLRDRFGGAVLTPPSTPKFRVAADGTVSELTTGFESVDEILADLDA